MGILPSAILVSLPLIGLMVAHLFKHWRDYHLIRLFGLAAILLMLFVGGVIVSVKIGGGSNLHNLDAYLTLLLVIASYIYFDCFKPDYSEHLEENLQQDTSPASNKLFRSAEIILIAFALVFPLYFTLSVGGALPHRDYLAAQDALQKINS